MPPPPSPPSPHDRLFRFAFGNPAHAAGELRAVLPPALFAKMDLSTLRLVPGSFVDDALTASQSDVLFEVMLGGRPALVYVLLEHQSTSDPWMAFRVLRYQVRIWDAYLAAHRTARRLPPIVPIVVSHADGGWRAATRFHELVDLRDDLRGLAGHVPSFRYVVDDLTRVSDEALATRIGSAFMRVVLLTLKHARGDLFATLERYIDVVRELESAPDAESALMALLRYTFYAKDDQAATVRLGSLVSGRAKIMAMNAADRLIAEGFEKGLQTGRALLRRQLELRFGPLPAQVVDRLDHATVDELTDWAERILEAPSLDALFAR